MELDCSWLVLIKMDLTCMRLVPVEITMSSMLIQLELDLNLPEPISKTTLDNSSNLTNKS